MLVFAGVSGPLSHRCCEHTFFLGVGMCAHSGRLLQGRFGFPIQLAQTCCHSPSKRAWPNVGLNLHECTEANHVWSSTRGPAGPCPGKFAPTRRLRTWAPLIVLPSRHARTQAMLCLTKHQGTMQLLPQEGCDKQSNLVCSNGVWFQLNAQEPALVQSNTNRPLGPCVLQATLPANNGPDLCP